MCYISYSIWAWVKYYIIVPSWFDYTESKSMVITVQLIIWYQMSHSIQRVSITSGYISNKTSLNWFLLAIKPSYISAGALMRPSWNSSCNNKTRLARRVWQPQKPIRKVCSLFSVIEELTLIESNWEVTQSVINKRNLGFSVNWWLIPHTFIGIS